MGNVDLGGLLGTVIVGGMAMKMVEGMNNNQQQQQTQQQLQKKTRIQHHMKHSQTKLQAHMRKSHSGKSLVDTSRDMNSPF